MATLAAEDNALAKTVFFSENKLNVELQDGRVISAPLDWFPVLENATETQRNNWQLLGDGEGIHWPEVDEDLSVAGLLAGNH